LTTTVLNFSVLKKGSIIVLCGPLTFTLLDATYGSETLPLTINNNPGSSATNIVTISPAATVTSSITGVAASGTVFKILNNYTVINGSNSGGTTRDLTITNTSTTTPYVIVIGSTGTTPVTNVTVKNCILTGGITSAGTVVTISDGTTFGNAGYSSNITLQNNSMSKAQMGIYAIANVASGNGGGLSITGNEMIGSAAASISYESIYVQGCDGVTISNNTLSNNTSASTVYPGGIWCASGTKNATISGNTVTNMSYTSTSSYSARGILFSSAVVASNSVITGNTVTNMSSAGSGTAYGIYVYGTGTEGVTVTKNKISNIKNSNSGGYNAIGLGLSSTSNTANVTVANNFIWDVAAYGYALLTTDNGYGINIAGGGGYNLYFNSVNMATNQTVAAYASCLFINSAVTAANSLDIRNNIFSIPMTTGTERYAVLCNAANTVFSYIDYNDYYSAGSNMGYIGSASQSNLAAWKIATTKDAHSVYGDPLYTSATDLHINVLSVSPTSNAGVTIGSVTDDIDGDVRTGTPDIGADEYTPPGCSGAVGGTTAVGTSTFCGSGTPSITASGYSVGTGSTYQWQYSSDNFSVDIHDFAGQTNPAALTTGAVTTTTYYRLRVTCTSGLATDYSTPTILVTIKPVPSASAGNSGPICEGATLNLTGTTDIGTTFSWTGPNSFSQAVQNPSIPSATTAANGTYTFTATYNGCTSAIATTNASVNAVPAAVTVNPPAPSVYAQNIQQLDAVGGTVSGVTILSENFDASAPGWTFLNGGSSPAVCNWYYQACPYTDASGSATFSNFSTLNGGKFAYSNSDAGGSGSTSDSKLISPVFSTVGFSTASISFEHAYRYYSAGDATVALEISTDGGGAWSTLKSY
ncbi:MAG: right-handed parallel beta-helix repeat-containing protein, partial [Bacteroidota bacterium]